MDSSSEDESSEVGFCYGSEFDESSSSPSEEEEEPEEELSGCEDGAIRSSNEDWDTVETFDDEEEDHTKERGNRAWRSFNTLVQNLSEGHEDAYTILSDRNKNVYDKEHAGELSMTPLMKAARVGDRRGVTERLQHKGPREVAQQDLSKKTALYYAVDSGFEEIALSIMAHMDDADLLLREKMFENSVLHAAVFYCLDEQSLNLLVIRALLERIDLEELTRPNLHMKSPFLESVEAGREDVARLLLPFVTDEGLMKTNGSGSNALHVAFRHCRVSAAFIAEVFHRCPPSMLEARNAAGRTPEECAGRALGRYPGALDLFKKHGPKAAKTDGT